MKIEQTVGGLFSTGKPLKVTIKMSRRKRAKLMSMGVSFFCYSVRGEFDFALQFVSAAGTESIFEQKFAKSRLQIAYYY